MNQAEALVLRTPHTDDALRECYDVIVAATVQGPVPVVENVGPDSYVRALRLMNGDPNELVWAAHIGKRIVGVLEGYRPQTPAATVDTNYIGGVHVLPEFWGRGYGTSMSGTFLNYFARPEAPTRLHTAPTNARMRKIATTYDFKLISTENDLDLWERPPQYTFDVAVFGRQPAFIHEGEIT